MLQEQALQILRNESPYGTPLENHCIRLAEISVELCKIENLTLDEDLLYAACYLHDIGLCVRDSEERNYLKRGLKFIEPTLSKWDLGSVQRKFITDVMLYSHSLPKIGDISKEGDLVRRAVRVEHSLGVITEGLSLEPIRKIFSNHPRKGFNKVLLGFSKTAVLDDGLGELVRVFFPKV